jgi:hypothetical protein
MGLIRNFGCSISWGEWVIRKPRRRCQNNIKISVDWIDVAQDRDKRCLLSIMAMNLVLSEKSRKYPDRLSNYHLFKTLHHAACKPLQCPFIIERHAPVTPASYLGGPRFRSRRPASLPRPIPASNFYDGTANGTAAASFQIIINDHRTSRRYII